MGQITVTLVKVPTELQMLISQTQLVVKFRIYLSQQDFQIRFA